jgi:subtilisin family serine protease
MARTSRSRSSSGESASSQPAGAPEPSAPRPRREPYLIAPRAPFGGGASAAEALAQRLAGLPDAEAVEVLASARADDAVVVARLGARRVEALRREAGAQLLIEADQPLTCARVEPTAAALECHDPGVATPHGPGFSTRVTVMGGGAPVAGAVVQLFGRIWSAGAITDDDGEAHLTLYGETPESISGLLVQARAGFWSRWLRRPALAPDDDHVVELTPLAAASAPADVPLGWGQRAMGLDRLPASWRGQGVRVALIDSGVASTHRQLAHVIAGIDIAGRAEQGWRHDDTGHGTHGAGLIAARADEAADAPAIRGFAPDAELHVCRIFPGGRLSDLIRALDYCIEQAIDVVSLGAGSAQGSQIVERRLVRAKQAGIACIAAAGNSAGRVEYPAASPHVLAVAAVGRAGSYPRDSYHATQSLDGREGAATGGLFAARFSCHGPEIDVAAPGVAVISCAPPDDVVAIDGTSAAAAHVSGLAALLLAHHAAFRGSVRSAARVERLFQIIKATAVPAVLGDPTRTGAGLPDAARAFNLAPDVIAPLRRAGAGEAAALGDLREVMRQAGLLDRAADDTGDAGAEAPEPPDASLRGPAVVGLGPLDGPAAPTNGSAVPLTLDGVRAAMADAALL